MDQRSLSQYKQLFLEGLRQRYSERECLNLWDEFQHFYTGYNRAEQVLNGQKSMDWPKFSQDLEALQSGKPLQYVLGEAYFCGMHLEVSPAALIPRPETEELVHWVQSDFQGKTSRILDIGTGTGCIALGLKKSLPNAEIWGMDISDEALELAQANGHQLKLEVQWKLASLFEVDFESKQFHAIVSNPPYIPANEAESMEEHVLAHEPHLALFVPNNDALLFYRTIAQKAKTWLKEGGHLYFEIHPDYASELVKMLEDQSYKSIELRKDLQDRPRMVKASL